MSDTDVPAGAGEGDDGGDVGFPPSPWWRRWWVWTAAAALVLVAVGVTVWAVQDDDEAGDAAPTTTSTPTTTTTTTTSTTTVPTTTTEPTTTTVEAVAAWINEHRLSDNIQVEIVCSDTGPIAVGGVLACQTAAPVTGPMAGEHAGVTVYVLDATGRSAYSVATDIPESTEALMATYEGSPKGLYCRDLLTDDIGLVYPFTQGSDPTVGGYFWSLMYWSLEGEPDRMDADLNGIPCETLYAPDVVAQVLEGGFV